MVTEPKLDLDQIRAVIKIASESPDVAELEVASETLKVVVKKVAGAVRPVVSTPASSPSASPAAVPSTQPAATGSTDQLVSITAPMVGTFYRAAKPDASPFVAEGDLVEPGQAVCIIEAMKLFNEIQSEVRGRVAKILVENASPVEYGQLLMLDGGGVFHQNLRDASPNLTLDFIEEFHRLDDAHRLSGFDQVPFGYERRGVGFGRAVKCPDHRGRNGHELVGRPGRRRLGRRDRCG